MGEKLKPCPFCGYAGKLEVSELDRCIAYCGDPNPDGPCPVSPETGFYDTSEQAIAAWNTRVPALPTADAKEENQ